MHRTPVQTVINRQRENNVTLIFFLSPKLAMYKVGVRKVSLWVMGHKWCRYMLAVNFAYENLYAPD